MVYITVKEASEKWNIGERRICILCKEGRIPGAVKKSCVWMIPETAGKPEDGRRGYMPSGIEPVLLIYNPVYFEGRNLKPTPTETEICEIQVKFLEGRLTEAYDELSKLMHTCDNNRYRFSFLFLKLIISADLGYKTDYLDAESRMKQILTTNQEFTLECILASYFLGQSDYIDSSLLSDAQYDELIPLISLITIKTTINTLINRNDKADITGLELICHNLEDRECPLITSYCHIYLAVYYNLIGASRQFDTHYQKALNILLPRKWYTPLAEYASTIDFSHIEQIDPEAYHTVSKLSATILEAYIRNGIFDGIVEQPRLENNTNIQIGYRLVQGKNNETIARELGISQYMVKKHIDDLYAIIGANSKKEIKEYVVKNLFV